MDKNRNNTIEPMNESQMIEFTKWYKRFVLESQNECGEINHPTFISLGANKSDNNKPFHKALAHAPHILLASKSETPAVELMKTWMITMMLDTTPKQLQFAIINTNNDKVFDAFEESPYLTTDVIKNEKDAMPFIEYLSELVSVRNKQMRDVGVKNIDAYNEWAREHNEEEWQSLIVFAHEFSNLMEYDRDIEQMIVRISQLANFVGIHLVISTSSVRAEVITGSVKVNLPTKVCFELDSSIESMILLNEPGGEKLLNEDMLVQWNGRETHQLQSKLIPIEYQPLLIKALSGTPKNIGKIDYKQTK